MDSVIGALRVILGADTTAFESGMKKAQGGLSRFGVQLTLGVETIAEGIGRALGAIPAAVGGVLQDADELAKMSQKIGIPIEDLSRLKHAADLSGLSLDGVATAVGRLSRNMSDVASGVGEEARRAFDALGISVKNADGTLRSSSDLLAEVADRFAAMPDGAQKTALAMQLMGRSGTEMIPLLNGGSDALRQMTEEADALGLTISAKTGAAAEHFNDNLTRLGDMLHGVLVQATSKVAEALSRVSDLFIENVKSSGLLEVGVTILAGALKGLVSAGVIVGETFKTIGTIIAAVAQAVMRTAEGNFAAAWNALKDGFQDVTASVQASANLIVQIWDETVDNVTSVSVRKLQAPIVEGMGKAGDATRQASADIVQSVQKIDSAASGMAQTIGETLGGLIKGTLDWRDAIGQVGGALLRLAATSMGGGQPGGLGALGNFASGILGSLLGFANGGQFQVAGVGGIDSQLVSFWATPGETVDVRKAGNAGSGGPGEIVVRIVSDASPLLDQRIDVRATGVAVQVVQASDAEKARAQELGG